MMLVFKGEMATNFSMPPLKVLLTGLIGRAWI
jgi:hypothetical protein